MADKVMTDVSMFLHPESFYQLRSLAQENNLGDLVISDRFVGLVKDSREDKLLEATFFNSLSKLFQIPIEINQIKAIQDFFGSESFNVSFSRFKRTYTNEHYILRNLYNQIGNDFIAEIIFEEWEFLTTNSWIFAKLRHAFDFMVEAGSMAIQVSKETFEKAMIKLNEKYQVTNKEITELVEKLQFMLNDLSDQAKRDFDLLVRLTLKKHNGDEISPNDRVRTLAKWVAVGGSSAVGVLPMAVFAANDFLLCDP